MKSRRNRLASLADVRLIGVEAEAFERVFMDMKASRARAAVINFGSPPTAQVAKLAIRYAVAEMISDVNYVKQGGLMSFTTYHQRPLLRLASIIDKIFRGMNPAEIPWELSERTHLAISLSTAKLLGLKVPPDLVLRADQVVE